MMMAAAAAAATAIAAAAVVYLTRILIRCKFDLYFFENKFMVNVANWCEDVDVADIEPLQLYAVAVKSVLATTATGAKAQRSRKEYDFSRQIAFILRTKMVKCQPQGETSANLMSDSQRIPAHEHSASTQNDET